MYKSTSLYIKFFFYLWNLVKFSLFSNKVNAKAGNEIHKGQAYGFPPLTQQVNLDWILKICAFARIVIYRAIPPCFFSQQCHIHLSPLKFGHKIVLPYKRVVFYYSHYHTETYMSIKNLNQGDINNSSLC